MVRFENPFYGKMGRRQRPESLSPRRSSNHPAGSHRPHYAKELQAPPTPRAKKTWSNPIKRKPEPSRMTRWSSTPRIGSFLKSKRAKGHLLRVRRTSHLCSMKDEKRQASGFPLLPRPCAGTGGQTSGSGKTSRAHERFPLPRGKPRFRRKFAESKGGKNECSVLLMPYSQAAGHAF